jgi:hypothetical protein
MAVVIEELTAEVTPDRTEGDEAEPRPAEGAPAQAVVDVLELAREREARLVVD